MEYLAVQAPIPTKVEVWITWALIFVQKSLW